MPIVPDEARTFGMEGDCSPRSASTRTQGPALRAGRWRRERLELVLQGVDQTGRSWKKGSPKPARCRSFIAAGTAYTTHGIQMIPFYIYYSMFGFQRVGDLIWLAADCRCQGLP